MTTNLSWRLSKLPTPEEIRGLVNDKIITQDEARDILFKKVDEKEVDKDSLEEEIQFLRKLVEKLSNNSSTTIYRYIQELPKYNYQWYQPYQAWCSVNDLSAGNLTTYTSSAGTSMVNCATNFSDIKTF